MAQRRTITTPPAGGMTKTVKIVPATIAPPESQPNNGLVVPADGWSGPGTRVANGGINPTVEWERIGETAIGVFRGMRPDIGENKSRVYDFAEPETGELFSIWGTTILDQRMDTLAPERGDYVRITYLGTVETERKQNPAKNFDVRVRPAAMGLPTGTPQ